MIFDDVIKSRRSIRRFREKEPSASTVEAIVEAARLSPSAKNRQPWYFSVLRGEIKKNFVADYFFALQDNFSEGCKATGFVLKAAPVIIAVYITRQSQTDLLSVGGAMYSMCLKATDLGLGSLWIGDTDIMKNDPKYENLAGVVAIGYAEESPSPRSRKKIEEISNLTLTVNKEGIEDRIDDPDLSSKDFVFISYTHKDRETVLADIIEMKHHGIPLWYDKALRYGRYWDEDAINIIRKSNCKVFLLYISYDSMISDNVLKEFTEAKERQDIKIIPILIGNTTMKELISLMRVNGFYKNAEIYERFFGVDERMLYISRSMSPRVLDHFQDILSALFENGISSEFSVYDHFSYVIKGKECIVTGYDGTGNVLKIPECISGYPVTEIAESAFSDNQAIEEVIFPTTLKVLGLGAFRGTGLKSVCLPHSVVEVQTACFRDCKELKEAIFPDGITYLAEALFRGCEKLERFEAPKTVVKMEEAVFRNCSSLQEVFLPDSLRSMTEGGFYGCHSLQRLMIPQTVEGAEIQSFDTSPLLERIRIGNMAFEAGKGEYIE